MYIPQFIFIFVAKSFHFCEQVVCFPVGDTLFFITYNFLRFYVIYAFRIHTADQSSLCLDCLSELSLHLHSDYFSALCLHLHSDCLSTICSHLNADCCSAFNSHLHIIFFHFQNFEYFVFVEIVS